MTVGALTSSSGGNDNLQVGLGVFCVIVSLVATMMVPMFVPGYDTGYEWEDIYEERTALEAYSGQSMVDQTPWVLSGVYTAYVPGEDYVISDEGWLYGESLSSYAPDGTNLIGETTGIRLDPTQKSYGPLAQDAEQVRSDTYKWYYDDDASGLWGFTYWLSSGFWGLFGKEVDRYEAPTVHSAWSFSGYLYEFDPMMLIKVKDPSGESGDQYTETDDAKLNIVWYDMGDGIEGLSGGLILYDNMSEGIVANFAASDIISNYDTESNMASSYQFDFNSARINMYIMFDQDVLDNDVSLSEAWTDGRWTLAFSAVSADGLLDLESSNTLSTSVGNMLQTYIDIFTFDVPSAPPMWSMVLWIICILPAEIAVLMFLSRFGIAGVGAGLLGNVLLAVGL